MFGRTADAAGFRLNNIKNNNKNNENNCNYGCELVEESIKCFALLLAEEGFSTACNYAAVSVILAALHKHSDYKEYCHNY